MDDWDIGWDDGWWMVYHNGIPVEGFYELRDAVLWSNYQKEVNNG